METADTLSIVWAVPVGDDVSTIRKAIKRHEAGTQPQRTCPISLASGVRGPDGHIYM